MCVHATTLACARTHGLAPRASRFFAEAADCWADKCVHQRTTPGLQVWLIDTSGRKCVRACMCARQEEGSGGTNWVKKQIRIVSTGEAAGEGVFSGRQEVGGTETKREYPEGGDGRDTTVTPALSVIMVEQRSLSDRTRKPRRKWPEWGEIKNRGVTGGGDRKYRASGPKWPRGSAAITDGEQRRHQMKGKGEQQKTGAKNTQK